MSTTWLWASGLSTALVKNYALGELTPPALPPANGEDDYGIYNGDKISIQSNNENAPIETDSVCNIDPEADEAKMDSVAKMQRQLGMARTAYIEKALHIPGAWYKVEPRNRCWDVQASAHTNLTSSGLRSRKSTGLCAGIV